MGLEPGCEVSPMPIEITIPRLGWNMDEGVFVAWLKSDGDAVKAGDPIFSLESDKSVQEIESIDSGILRIAPNAPNAGDTVAVGALIGYLVEPGESPTIPAPTATKIAEAKAETFAEAPPPETASRSDRLHAASTPRARRKARELGLNMLEVPGTGRGGRIRERDVVAAAGAGRRRPGEAHRSAGEERQSEPIPLTAIRRLIAGRMMEGAHGTAPVTLTTSIDATNLVNLRGQFKAASQDGAGGGRQAVIGFLDIVVKLTALSLERHSLLNACWDEDRILAHRAINIGLAVDTDAGLIVPVIRDVPALSLREVAVRSRSLIDAARRRALSPEALQGATFTVTNLGPLGIDAFTPIISAGQSAVLGIGRIRREIVPVGSRHASRERLTLSLTFDHRVVDGAPAARFLMTLTTFLENPSPWLMP